MRVEKLWLGKDCAFWVPSRIVRHRFLS